MADLEEEIQANITEFEAVLQKGMNVSTETTLILNTEIEKNRKILSDISQGDLVPILSWAKDKELTRVIQLQGLPAVSRLTEEARMVLSDFLRECMDVYKKGKVIENLDSASVCVVIVDAVGRVDYGSRVMICGVVLTDLTEHSFSTYLTRIHHILEQFGDKCHPLPDDFDHLISCFIDIRQQGLSGFSPALLVYHPSVLARLTLSRVANLIFLEIRHKSKLINKLDEQLRETFNNNAKYGSPFSTNFTNPSYKFRLDLFWNNLNGDGGISSIVGNLGKKTVVHKQLLKSRVAYLLFVRDCVHHFRNRFANRESAEDAFIAIYPYFLPVLFHASLRVKEIHPEDLFNID